MSTDDPQSRVTLRTVRHWARDGEKFPMLTCYDATTAQWLWLGGVRTLLVGDTAAEMILGHDSTLPATVPFLVELTAAVRRGAPNAFIMADMPFGSYHCGDDAAMGNAMRFLTEGRADVVKLEVDASFAPLVERMAHAGIPVVAHVGSRPQQVRQRGGYGSVGRSRREADEVVEAAQVMVRAGAAMLLIEAVPAEVSQRIVELAQSPRTAEPVPVVGCGAGPACHGHVVVLHDLVGLTNWHPPFVHPVASLGESLQNAAAAWSRLVKSGQYLAKDHPYKMDR
jgi:3-methyl-2-oxobutanoate hydroxymethyltransferase